jgi:hypothetical protein
MAIVTPDGMRKVNKEEFFEALYADKTDIMPSCSESENYSAWMTPQRCIWGYTYPGWKHPMEEKGYFIKN